MSNPTTVFDGSDDEAVLVDEDSRRPGDRVRVIQGLEAHLHKPKIRIGRVTQSGVTVIVHISDEDRNQTTYHLEAAELFDGSTVAREERTFRLYTRERFRDAQRENREYLRVDQIADWNDLPAPTHRPTSDVEAAGVVT